MSKSEVKADTRFDEDEYRPCGFQGNWCYIHHCYPSTCKQLGLPKTKSAAEVKADTATPQTESLKIHADRLAYDVEILLSYLSVEDRKLWGVMKIQQELDAYNKFREETR